MIRAIVWKELREQGLIALTLVVLGGGVLVAAAALADPPSPGARPADVVQYLGFGQLATLMLAVTAGMVCGGAVFAAEREAGTFSFLDSLPASRWELWQAKLLAGLGLVVVQVALLIAVAIALGPVGHAVGAAIAISLYSLLAFVWGMLGSTTARTTLGSVGVAIPAATLTALFVLIPVTLFFQSPGASAAALLGVASLPRVHVRHAALDVGMAIHDPRSDSRGGRCAPRSALPVMSSHARLRGGTAGTSTPVAGSRTAPVSGLTALLWLSFRQMLLPGLVLSLFAMFFGLVTPRPVCPAVHRVARAGANGGSRRRRDGVRRRADPRIGSILGRTAASDRSSMAVQDRDSLRALYLAPRAARFAGGDSRGV